MAELRTFAGAGAALALTTLLGCGAILGLTDPAIDDNLVLDGGADAKPDVPTGADGCILCGNVCPDLANDTTNCGRCGRSCLGLACNQGRCDVETIQTTNVILGLYVDDKYLYFNNGYFDVVRVDKATPTASPTPIAKPNGFLRGFTVTKDVILMTGGGSYSQDAGLNQGTIASCPITGCTGAATALPVAYPGIPSEIAAAPGVAIVYSDVFAGSVERCTYPDCATTAPTGFSGEHVSGVGVDGTGLFFTVDSKNNPNAVRSCPTTGCTNQGSTLTAASVPVGVAARGGFVYAALTGDGQIVRINTSGPPTVTVIAKNLARPLRPVVDDAYVYWVNEGNVFGDHSTNGTVARCPIAGCPGGNAEILVEKLDRPNYIAIDGTTAYFAALESPSNLQVWSISRVGK